MNFCVSHRQIKGNHSKLTEVRFKNQAINEAIEFAANHFDKKVIIEITNKNETPLQMMLNLQEEYPNVYYDFHDLATLIDYSKKYKAKFTKAQDTYPYMLHIAVMNWGLVLILRYYKVSDILIGEPLFFQMTKVKREIKDKGIKIRFKPTTRMAEAFAGTEEPGIRHAWMIPSQMYLYEDYIDVLELVDEKASREEALVNIFAGTTKFNFSISAICPSVVPGIPAAYVDEEWTRRRLNCEQKCLENSNGCVYCEAKIKMYDAWKKWHSIALDYMLDD